MIVIYSRFIWLNGSMSLIRLRQKGAILLAFLRWPLSLWPRKLLLGVKWSRWEQNCRSTLTQAKTLFPCENQLYCFPCQRMTLHRGTWIRRVWGVYLPIGWVFPSYSMIFGLCWTWEDYVWLWIALSNSTKVCDCVISAWCWQVCDVSFKCHFAKIVCARHWYCYVGV